MIKGGEIVVVFFKEFFSYWLEATVYHVKNWNILKSHTTKAKMKKFQEKYI